MNGFQNPYLNPYAALAQQYAPQVQPAALTSVQPQRQVDKVNGRNGAQQYPMGPNSQAWILDESGVISWLIITDSAGYKTATPYDVKPHKEEPEPDYESLESRIKKLEEIVNANAGSAATARKKQSDDGTD